jgi:hypothetical protein
MRQDRKEKGDKTVFNSDIQDKKIYLCISFGYGR